MAALGSATPNLAGQKAKGMMHFKDIKADVLLSTFQKIENKFSPTTMHADYLINRSQLYLKSWTKTVPHSTTGQNLLHHSILG